MRPDLEALSELFKAIPQPLTTTHEQNDGECVAATRSVSVLRRAIAHGVTLSVGVDTPAVLPIDLLGQIRLAHILLQHTDAQAMHDAGRIAAALAGEAKDERS
ncbi:hypothetical protein ACQP1V_28110 [Microtetraspora malaysiensis]|uniref:hypothetical protein n=1 Tax=Microtetraspora malaysiensis TaxID=161358 RepID=UPI003D89DD95